MVRVPCPADRLTVVGVSFLAVKISLLRVAAEPLGALTQPRGVLGYLGGILVAGTIFTFARWYAVAPMIVVSFFGLRWAARAS